MEAEAEMSKPGFFSKERIKARWTKIGKWIVKNLWPIIEQELEDALRRELEKRKADSDSPPAAPSRPTDTINQ